MVYNITTGKDFTKMFSILHTHWERIPLSLPHLQKKQCRRGLFLSNSAEETIDPVILIESPFIFERNLK